MGRSTTVRIWSRAEGGDGRGGAKAASPRRGDRALMEAAAEAARAAAREARVSEEAAVAAAEAAVSAGLKGRGVDVDSLGGVAEQVGRSKGFGAWQGRLAQDILPAARGLMAFELSFCPGSWRNLICPFVFTPRWFALIGRRTDNLPWNTDPDAGKSFLPAPDVDAFDVQMAELNKMVTLPLQSMDLLVRYGCVAALSTAFLFV